MRPAEGLKSVRSAGKAPRALSVSGLALEGLD